MDDAKKLIHWALNLESAKITNFDWPNRFGLDLSDYFFQFKLKNREYDGRGVGSTSEVSLLKAIVEAIERTALCENSVESSNGVAAHFSLNQAEENAISELLERDIFLCTFLYPQAGVKKVDPAKLSLNCNRIVQVLGKNNIQVTIYELGVVLGRTVILAIANGFAAKMPFGCVIGLGSNTSSKKAGETALIEMARNVVTYIDTENCEEWSKSESEFFRPEDQKFSILEHARIALSRDYGLWLWSYFVDKEQYPVVATDIHESEITIKHLIIDKSFSKLGLHVIQASSATLQNLFFHKTTPEKVNLARIERFAKTQLLFEDLNLRTHPIA